MKDSRTKPYLLCMFGYFVLGCMVMTVNTAMKSIMAEYNWTDTQGSMLITSLSAGFLVTSLIGNLLMEKLGRRNTMIIGAMILTVSFTLFTTVSLPVLFYPFLFCAGLTWGAINNLVNTIVSQMYDGSSARLNLLHACYAIGATLLPLLVGFMTQNHLSWRVPAAIIIVLGALLLVTGLVIRLPEKPRAAASTKGETTENFAFWREFGFYLSFLTLFLYVGVETAASSWISPYLSQTNSFFAEHVPSETMVSLMWGMMLVGRIFFATVGGKLDRKVLLIVLSCGYMLGLTGVTLLGAYTVPAIACVALQGLSMSAMYAAAMSNATRYVTGPALAAGMLFGGGSLGSTLMPLAAGMVSDAVNLKAGMLVLCGCLCVLVLISILIRRNAGKQGT